MQSIVVNLSIIRFNRNLESSSAYGLLNWMTLPTRLSAEPKLRPGGSSRGRYKSRLARNTRRLRAPCGRGKLGRFPDPGPEVSGQTTRSAKGLARARRKSG